jgi:hypothetical protein
MCDGVVCPTVFDFLARISSIQAVPHYRFDNGITALPHYPRQGAVTFPSTPQLPLSCSRLEEVEERTSIRTYQYNIQHRGEQLIR